MSFEPNAVNDALTEIESAALAFLAAAEERDAGRLSQGGYLAARWAFRRARAAHAREHGIEGPALAGGGTVLEFKGRVPC